VTSSSSKGLPFDMMMCSQTTKLPQAFLAIPYWCTILLFICSLPSASTAKSRTCPHSASGPDEDPSNMYMRNTTPFNQIDGFLLVANSTVIVHASLNSSRKNYSPSNLSETGLFIIGDLIELSEISTATAPTRLLHEASFSVVFTLSIYKPTSNNPMSVSAENYTRMIFAIMPEDFITNDSEPMPTQLNCDTDMYYFITGHVAGNHFYIGAGVLDQTILNDTVICVEILMEILKTPSSSTNYSISIHYNASGHSLEAQVSADGDDIQGQQSFNFSNVSWHVGYFSLSSSMGQLFQVHTWNSTVERLSHKMEISPKKKGTSSTMIILCSVLGSAAATVAIAVVVYCYFNSKYRGWKKELDQLAKSMQRLPGVPTQFSFSDIQRATNNFHETSKLGRGGFGTVYKCSLPARKRGEVLEVAVKKFSRDDNRRYEDFLAEVSVINRLRHKNIVPLVGWSYNKGEPLLIYEYMPNGSLDQHLFRKSSGKEHQQPALINQLGTRYNMVKDIATGLHYVHHEYEPMVLHRDIKTSNIMVDSNFQGRLGDFGLACVVAKGKNSYTDIGPRGTPGFMSPEYILSGKATSKSDVFAFGVLILEIITGKLAVDAQFRHITDWVWHHHKEGRLLTAVDSQLMTEEFDPDDAKRLLLIGLACSHPNPSDRPNMVEAVQIITKSVAPPDVPLEKPRFVWEQEERHLLSSDYSTELSSLNRSLTSGIEMTSGGLESCENGGNSLHHRPTAGPSHELFSIYHAAE